MIHRLRLQCLIFCTFFLIEGRLSAQKRLPKNVHYSVEAGGFVSAASTTPFWIRSNQYGEAPLKSQTFGVRGELYRTYDSLKRASATKKLDFGYGLRIAANAGGANSFLLTEAYAKIRYKAFEMYAGRRRETMGISDTTLGMGSYIWSGNSLPIPKIQIALLDFTPIIKSGLLAVKGNIAQGWFGSGDSTQNYMLHQKSIYFRLGKPHWRFRLYSGINHQVQWGGRPTIPFLQGGTNAFITEYGSNLFAFAHVLTGIGLQELGYYKGTTIASGEGGNRLGNHLGTLDLALEYRAPSVKWLLYRQSIYEDGSLSTLSSISDGLLGLSISTFNRKKFIQKIVLEYLSTDNQGGFRQSGNQTAAIPELRGADDYLNNATYEEGWTYRRKAIGTPFIMPLNELSGITVKDIVGAYNPRYPVNPYALLNNRVKAWMIGIQSQVKSVNLLTRLSYSQNMGKYYLDSRVLLQAIDINQISLQQQAAIPIKQYLLTVALAYDSQGVLENNVGMSIFLKRHF